MTPNSPVVYTTCETVLDKFTGCEVVFTAGKNAALCTGFRYIHIFDHLNLKLTLSYLDDVFEIF